MTKPILRRLPLIAFPLLAACAMPDVMLKDVTDEAAARAAACGDAQKSTARPLSIAGAGVSDPMPCKPTTAAR